MRVTLLFIIILATLGALIWLSTSGIPFLVAVGLWLILLIITVIYSDAAVLFLLGARKIRPSDEERFFEAASQEAYKLAVRSPELFFYNGALERAFILQNGKKVSLVLSKTLLEKCSTEELTAICFELLLQVKKGMAEKRTRAMFLIGIMVWFIHSFFGLVINFIPVKEVKQVTSWFINFFLNPLIDLLFSLIVGKGYFKKIVSSLSLFPREEKLLQNVGLKLRKPSAYYSLPSRKILELGAASKSRHFRSIIALEFLPHEWDYLFSQEQKVSAK